MNIGYEDDELRPYMEPEADLNDQFRIRKTGLFMLQCCDMIRFRKVELLRLVSRAPYLPVIPVGN